jgi:hypothetical protein
MAKLNWKGDDERHWRAVAARAVGGRYEIMKCGGGRDWTGFYSGTWYRVDHRSSADIKAGNTGRGLSIKRPPDFRSDAALTLLEAMTIAQADNDERCSVQSRPDIRPYPDIRTVG